MDNNNNNNNNTFDFQGCDNDFKCWECEKKCHMKRIFGYPDELFYAMLNKSSKVVAGELILSGIPFNKAEEVRQQMVMMLNIARTKYLEKNY